jgi:branched-chain amino acid transport system permease protein
MSAFLSFTVLGLFTGAAYAIAASGLVLTYSTTRIFNIAHGAMGMFLAFTYWDINQRQGLPTWATLLLVLGVIAPLFGMLIYLSQMRDLAESTISVSLVVTLGVFVGLIGLATLIWPPSGRFLPPFFGDGGFELAGAFVTYHHLLTIILSGLVAVALYVLLNYTTIGISMRAAVDNPDLLRLYGGRPQLVSTISWGIGATLAALAGILLTPVLGLDYHELTFLVVNAYAAAMLGRLISLPWTFVGAMLLGVMQAYAVGYLPSSGAMIGFRPAIPTIFLFLIILLMPQAPLRVGQIKGIVSAPVPSVRRTAVWGAAALFAVALLTVVLETAHVLLVGTALVYMIVMLSLVLLTGYGGFVSLAQLTFTGVGALLYVKLDMAGLTGLLLAALLTGVVGALVALPTLRLTGLYLALSTMAFGLLMDRLIFQAEFAFGFNGTLPAERPSLLGVDMTNVRTYVVALALLFVLLAAAVVSLRRGRLGRILVAMKDSPAACGTLGLNLRWLRVGVFAGSAAIAGFAGGLFAGLRGTISATDFVLFASLPLLLVAVAWGVTSVTGAVIGGVSLMLLPVMGSLSIWAGAAVFVFVGFGAVELARDPNGLANRLFQLGRFLGRRLGQSRAQHAEPAPMPTPEPEGRHLHGVA